MASSQFNILTYYPVIFLPIPPPHISRLLDPCFILAALGLIFLKFHLSLGITPNYL